MSTTTATAICWATLKYGPTEPKSSKGFTPQHSACVQLVDREEEAWIYFNPGLESYLQEGDTFLCAWKKGKWRLDTLTPELTAILRSRMSAAQSASAPTAAPTPTPTAEEPPEHPSERQPKSELTIAQLRALHADGKTYSTLMLSIQSELIRGATTQSGDVGITASQLEAYAIAIFNRVVR